jgi:hypothetical protein
MGACDNFSDALNNIINTGSADSTRPVHSFHAGVAIFEAVAVLIET